tara:strand:- start:2180 stop:4318 length:2139 start_codon:yes stop_codon:yes gene_type:complete
MGFLVSPGVHVREIDLTNIVPALQTNIGAIAGPFEKGPVATVVNIGSEAELVNIFGKPNSSNFEYFFTAANFLQYSNALKVVRCESGVLNAASELGVLIRDTDHYTNSFRDGQASVGPWAARTAGDHGNSLAVSICATATAFSQDITGANQVNGAASSGATSVTVDDVDLASNVINVGDILSFFTDSGFGTPATGHAGKEYEVTARDTANNTVTIRELDNPNGTGLAASLADNSYIRRRWKFYDLFDAAPGTSKWSETESRGTADEMHIVVYDTTGKISGFAESVAGQRTLAVLETYTGLSKNPKAKTVQGGTNYYVDVIYTRSAFIYWMDHLGAGTNWGSDLDLSNDIILNGTDATGSDEGGSVLDETDGDSIIQDSGSGAGAYTAVDSPTLDSLTGGTDDYDVSLGEKRTAYDLFANAELHDINFVLGGPSVTVTGTSFGSAGDEFDTHGTMITDLAELRKDLVAFISPARQAVVNVQSSNTQTVNVKNCFDTLPSSSYVVYDSGYKYMYDKYNDVFRYVPLNGDIAGLCAHTDKVADPWFSPGGYNRGNIRGAIKLAYNPQQAERDILYKARINPVVDFPGQGVVLFGDKTALTRPSAFDRINVRRLFLVLEKAIATAAKYMLFEFNDEFTRAQFRNMVEPFLRDVQGRRGITDFQVVADATNNTGEVIDRNEFIGDIYIKPARSINFITLNFVAVRTGVEFSEVVGKF